MSTEKSIIDLKASVRILACNIRLFHEGERELYRVIATELRKLLCEGQNSLLVRLFPGLHLEYLDSLFNNQIYDNLKRDTGIDIKARLILHLPGKMIGHHSRVFDLFKHTGDYLPIDKWLEQPFMDTKITLQDFIKSVADKESVHSDKEYNSTLLKAKSAHIGSEEMHKPYIIAIGEYVLEVIEQLEKDHLIRDEIAEE